MLNCFTAVGRVAKRDCRKSATGMLMVKFTLAVARDKDKNGEIKTDFINCVIFGNQGNYFEQYAETGAMLSVQGSIRTNPYESNGQKTVFTECLVSSYKILVPAGVNLQKPQQAPTPAPVPLPQPPPPQVAPVYPTESEMLPFDLPPEMYMGGDSMTPINELRQMLTAAGIPFESYMEGHNAFVLQYMHITCLADQYSRNQIIYGRNGDGWKIDAIFQYGSYGRKEGLLELWGDLIEGDPITATPAEAFEMIKADWEKTR